MPLSKIGDDLCLNEDRKKDILGKLKYLWTWIGTTSLEKIFNLHWKVASSLKDNTSTWMREIYLNGRNIQIFENQWHEYQKLCFFVEIVKLMWYEIGPYMYLVAFIVGILIFQRY